jgi:16S rRNA U516 pseudouridylate synthase RsuA-like enzyme
VKNPDGKRRGQPDERRLKTLERLFSKAGQGSRSDARSAVQAGRVRVNGAVIRNPDHWVDLDSDRVTVDGRPLGAAAPLYLLLYKPRGYVTTSRDQILPSPLKSAVVTEWGPELVGKSFLVPNPPMPSPRNTLTLLLS